MFSLEISLDIYPSFFFLPTSPLRCLECRSLQRLPNEWNVLFCNAILTAIRHENKFINAHPVRCKKRGISSVIFVDLSALSAVTRVRRKLRAGHVIARYACRTRKHEAGGVDRAGTERSIGRKSSDREVQRNEHVARYRQQLTRTVLFFPVCSLPSVLYSLFLTGPPFAFVTTSRSINIYLRF